MNLVISLVRLLSLFGFLLSAAAHFCSLTGLPQLLGRHVFVLHIGIFLVWLPAVLVSQSYFGQSNKNDYWKNVSAACPPWIARAGIVLFAYCIVNFLVFMSRTSTHSGAHSGPRAAPAPADIAGFSGHWMLFYFAAFAIMQAALNLLNSRTAEANQGSPALENSSVRFDQSAGRFSTPEDIAGRRPTPKQAHVP